jgi:hypothetical protein
MAGYGYREIAGLAAVCRLAGQRQGDVADLVARGTEGSSETAQTRSPVADGRIVHPLAIAASQPCVVYDFVEDCTHDGRKFRMLNVLD